MLHGRRFLTGLAAGVTFFVAATCTARAQEEDDEPRHITGAMVGAEITSGGGGLVFGPTFHYWGESLGIRAGFTMGSFTSELSAGGSKVESEQSATAMGAALLLGFPFESSKPYVSLGLNYSSAEQSVTSAEAPSKSALTSTDFQAGVGINFLAGEHVVIDLGLFEIGFVLSGEVKQGDDTAKVGGKFYSILNRLGIRYVF